MRILPRRLAPVIVAVGLVALSCGKNESPTDPQRLCGGEAGVGLKITGLAQPLDFCVATDRVSATLTSSNRYSVFARVVNADGVYELQMVFANHTTFPVNLIATENLSAAEGDPGFAWIFLQEIPKSGPALESYEITDGVLTLTFSGGDVAAGTLSNVRMKMREVATQDPASSRAIAEGFFSISTVP